MFIRTGHLDRVADALSDISTVYFRSSQFEKALESILEAREAAKGSAMTRTNSALRIEFKHGCYLCALQRDAEALPIFQECLSIFELAGQLGSSAECFKHMGLLHIRQGNHGEARVAVEGAIAKHIQIGDTTASGREEIRKLEELKEQLTKS